MELTKFNSQLFAAFEQVAVHIRQALNTLIELGKLTLERAQRLQQARRARGKDLRTLVATSLDTIAVKISKIVKFNSRLFAAFEQVAVQIRRARNTLTELGKTAFERAQKLQEAPRERENDLRELLASSLDAIVVTDVDRQFVAANPNALHLFGVSEINMKQFTIDAFLLKNQLLDFDADGLSFIGRGEKQGECQIRRLDGRLRLAEYTFVANFVPFRHLFIFRNDRACARVKRVAA